MIIVIQKKLFYKKKLNDIRFSKEIMTYIFCAHRMWAKELFQQLKKRYKTMELVEKPEKLTYRFLKKKNPKMIIFPDWSWIIPKEIVDNFNCVHASIFSVFLKIDRS